MIFSITVLFLFRGWLPSQCTEEEKIMFYLRDHEVIVKHLPEEEEHLKLVDAEN